MKIACTEILVSHRKKKGEQRLAAAVEQMLAILAEEERMIMVSCYSLGLLQWLEERP